MISANHRPLFRETALRRHTDARVANAMPRMVSPPAIRYYWTLTVFLVLGFIFCLRTKVPAFVSVPAVVVPSMGSAKIVAFFPPKVARNIRPPARLWIADWAGGSRQPAAIVSIGTSVETPAEVGSQYGSAAASFAASLQPSTLVTAEWHGPPDAVGTVTSAELEIGRQSMLAVFTTMGSFPRR